MSRAPGDLASAPPGPPTLGDSTRTGPAWAAPVLVFLSVLAVWEGLVRWREVPHYILPAPSQVLLTLWADGPSLLQSLVYTLQVTLIALALAVAGGVALAVLFALSRRVERALFPIAIVLQVTPIIAVAPLIMIYVESITAALVLCTFIVAFFPILASTVVGLRSTDPHLRELFALHGATPVQRLRLLLLPSALPYFLSGLKIAGGLALIGAVGAEFAAGAAGRQTGLASRILEASFRIEIPKMFAALTLVSLLGIALYMLFDLLSRWLLSRWHDSETLEP